MADPLKPGSGSTEAENADKQAEFDRMVLALANIPGFEAAFRAAMASCKKGETPDFYSTPFVGARLGVHWQGGRVSVEDRDLFIARFQDHFLDGVVGDPTAARVVRQLFGWEAAPEADALPGERQVVRAEAAEVLDDAEKQRQLEEFKNTVKDVLIGSDGWKRQAMQEAVLNPARMQLREFLNQPTVHFLIAALQGLQQHYGFAKEDESFLAAFVEVFLKELNQDLRVEPGKEAEWEKFCLDRAAIVWREIFEKQEEWQRTPPPPVRSAEPLDRTAPEALSDREVQDARTISDFIESKKPVWEALFKESQDRLNPVLSGSLGYQKLRAELRDALINLGYAEDPMRLIAVMDRVLQLFRFDSSNPVAAERALDDFVCNLLVRMVKGIFQDGALKDVARVERQPVAPLLFQAGGPRGPDLPPGMPQPFRIEKVMSSVKLGAQKDHEVYQTGNVHAMAHIGIEAEGKQFRQEDRAGVTVFKTKEGRVVTRLTIADGMGGVEDGELAADLAVDALGQPVPYLEAEKMVRGELKKRGAKEAGACVVSVDICGSIAHLHRRGDARIYHFDRKGNCVWMSKDECRATQVKDYDLPLEEDELRRDAKKRDRDGVPLNVVTNDLSTTVGDKPLDVLAPRVLMPGDVLVLCSDGLSDTMGNQEIYSGLQGGTLLKDLLARMKSGQGKKDNVSVIVYEMPLTQGGSRLTPQKITESLNP